MRVSEYLADLASLQACEPSAALALVSARPQTTEINGTDNQAGENDADLKRAKDLLELHATTKRAHHDGTDKELSQAREAVAKALATL